MLGAEFIQKLNEKDAKCSRLGLLFLNVKMKYIVFIYNNVFAKKQCKSEKKRWGDFHEN